jgi:hypothetical protein
MKEKTKETSSLKQKLKEIALKIWRGFDCSVSWAIGIFTDYFPFFLVVGFLFGLFMLFSWNCKSISDTRTFGTLELVTKAQFDSNAQYALSFKGEDGRTSVYKMTGGPAYVFASTSSDLEHQVTDPAHRSILFNELVVGKKYVVCWCIYSDDKEILYIKPTEGDSK